MERGSEKNWKSSIYPINSSWLSSARRVNFALCKRGIRGRPYTLPAKLDYFRIDREIGKAKNTHARAHEKRKSIQRIETRLCEIKKMRCLILTLGLLVSGEFASRKKSLTEPVACVVNRAYTYICMHRPDDTPIFIPVGAKFAAKAGLAFRKIRLQTFNSFANDAYNERCINTRCISR